MTGGRAHGSGSGKGIRMGEMVDRVKAVIKLNIENAQIGKDGRVFDKYELAAKEAIEAMYRPTENMLEAGNELERYNEGYCSAEEHWQVMIDAALKE